MREDFTYLCLVNVGELYKLLMHFMFPMNYLSRKQIAHNTNTDFVMMTKKMQQLTKIRRRVFGPRVKFFVLSL